MPFRGKPPSAQRAPIKRVLRAHSKLTAAGELHSFFTESTIPKFNEQLLEAYITAIKPNYESELEPSHLLHHNASSSAITANTQRDSDESSDNLLSSARHPDDDINSERSTSPDQPRKVYLVSGLFSDVQQNKKQTKPAFSFPLPASSSRALDKKSNFVLPYSIYCPSNTKKPIWKNLKRSMYCSSTNIYFSC